MEIDKMTLAQLEELLGKAQEEYACAVENEGNARRASTAARNNLNRMQEAIDRRLLEMRKTSPQGSEWANSVAPRYECSNPAGERA